MSPTGEQPWRTYYEETYDGVRLYMSFAELRSKSVAQHLESAYAFIYNTLIKHERKNGESYFLHAHRSVKNLLDLSPTLETILLCLLHDVPKLEPELLPEIKKIFGEVVYQKVEKFLAIRKVHETSKYNSDTHIMMELLLALADDLEVILVKFATRLDSLTTLGSLPKDRQSRIASEALYIFAPLATRMGIYSIKVRLEDESFKVLYPKTYLRIERERDELISSNATLLDEAKGKLTDLMMTHGISGAVYHRIKSIYSIATKMHKKNVAHVADLYDIFALRFVLASKEECYKLLGYVHATYPPLPGRIKDYIALPKENNYQSLHTTIVGIYDKNPSRSVEVQIRTQRMDDVAEYGIASHVGYKDPEERRRVKEQWQRKLEYYKKSFHEHGQLDNISSEMNQGFQYMFEKIYVLTPSHEVISLPKGATALDFAYAIHTDIGHQCIAAKVNGIVASLDSSLRSGDTVEIVTRKGHIPTATSLLYAKTAGARNKIRQFLRSQDSEGYTVMGQAILDKYLREHGSAVAVSEAVARYTKERGSNQRADHVLSEIGRGRLNPSQILPLKSSHRVVKKKKAGGEKMKLAIAGSPYMPFSIAGCCKTKVSNLPVEELVAYVNMKQEIKVHARSCRFLGNDHDRWLDVSSVNS